MQRTKIALLRLDYLLGAAIILCQILYLRQLVSILFYISFFVSAALWVCTTTESLDKLDWLAIAIVIFATWKPCVAIFGSYLFGALYILYNYINVPMQLLPLFQMLPYAVTILVLVAVSIRKKRENQPPASLGLSYFREDR